MQQVASAAGASKPKAPSQSPHACYKLEMTVPFGEGPALLEDLARGAKTFLARFVSGGTENPLRVIVAVGSLATAPRTSRLCHVPSGAGSSGGPIALNSQGEQHDAATAHASPSSAGEFVVAKLTVLTIFDGTGRLKSSVVRSMKALSLDPRYRLALQALHPYPLASALQFIAEHPLGCVKTEWLGGVEQDVIQHLQQRIAADNQTPQMRASNSAQLACSGIDVLVPHSRKRTLEPPSIPLATPSSSVLASPKKMSSVPAAKPPQEALATLLSWNGDINGEEAARRANGILELVQKTMEENAVYKIAQAGTLDTRKVLARASLPTRPFSCLQLLYSNACFACSYPQLYDSYLAAIADSSHSSLFATFAHRSYRGLGMSSA